MKHEPDKTAYVGGWQVEPALNRLTRGDETVRLTPKVMQVLVYLLERPGAVVSREQLLDVIWAGTVVNDDVVTRAVSELRKAFDDDPQAPQVIETISKSGYRLIAPVAYPYSGDTTPFSGDAARPAGDGRAGDGQATAQEVPSLVVPRRRSARTRHAGAALLVLAAGLVGAAAWLAASHRGAPAPAAQPVPLTALPGREIRPALAPDGRQVAFTWRGADGANADLYVQLAGGGPPLRLTTDAAFDVGAAWSPDGTRLAFMRHTDDGCEVYVVPALGGAEAHLGSCAGNVNPDLAWSPDGRWLAFSDRPAPSESFSLFLLSPETGERRRLTAPDDQHWGDRDPAFSPDGTRLAFTRSVSMGTQDVFVVPVAGGAPERVTHDAAPVDGAAWAADGTHLVVASGRGGAVNLWRVPLDGGAPAWIAAAGLAAHRPTLAPGGALAFEQRHDRSTLLRLAPGAAPAPWLPATRADLAPHLSPDGRRVAFASDRDGTFELWVSDLDAPRPLRLTHFGGTFVDNPRWSPDGTRLAFDARPDGHADVFVVDAAGGRPLRRTAEPSNELAPAWSPDGRWLYFGSNRSGAWQVWKLPAAGGGAAVQVTHAGGYAAQPAPDGATLYFTKYDRPGIWQMPAGGGAEAAVAGTEGVVGAEGWLVAADALFFLLPAGDSTHVRRLDRATGRPEDVATLPAGVSGLTRSADGRVLLVTRHDPGEIDLLLLPAY